MENFRFLKYTKENDNFMLSLSIDEYREVQNALQLLSKKRVIAKNYYYKNKNKVPTNKTNKISLLLPMLPAE